MDPPAFLAGARWSRLHPLVQRLNAAAAAACCLPADDSWAFQRAIDAAVAAAGPGNGKAVVIPPGRYTILRTISIGGSHVVLRGSGVSWRGGRAGFTARLQPLACAGPSVLTTGQRGL